VVILYCEIRIFKQLQGSETPIAFDYEIFTSFFNSNREFRWIGLACFCYVARQVNERIRTVIQKAVNSFPIVRRAVRKSGILGIKDDLRGPQIPILHQLLLGATSQHPIALGERRGLSQGATCPLVLSTADIILI
jgi:hypothetical protein